MHPAERTSGNTRMGSPEERPLLLIIADRKERALILAELQERGYDVRALPGIVLAVGYLVRRPRVVPRLVIVDVVGDPDVNEHTLGDLLALTPHSPWVVITSATRAFAGHTLLKNRKVTLLSRPVTVGDVVKAVEQALKALEG